MPGSRLNSTDRFHRRKIGPTNSDDGPVAYTGTAARTSALEAGFYRIVTTTASHIRQGDVTVAATTNDYPLAIGQEAFMEVDYTSGGQAAVAPFDGDDRYVSAIQQSSGGNMFVNLISRLTATE